MLETLRKSYRLLSAPSRRNYLLLLPLSILTGLAETIAAAGIYTIITVITDPSRGLNVPWVAAVTRHLPWQSQSAVILQLTGLLAAFYMARGALLIAVQYFRIRVAHEASADLSCSMLRRYLSAAYPFHFSRNSSDLIRNCTTSVHEWLFVLFAVSGLVTDLLMAIGMIAVLMVTSPALSLGAGALLLVIVLVILRITRRAAARLGEEHHALEAVILQSLQQSLGAVKELIVLGRTRAFLDDFTTREREAQLVRHRARTLDSVPVIAVQTALVCGGLAMVAVLTVTGRAGVQSLPIAAVFGYAGLRMLPMANAVVQTLNHVRMIGPAVDELYADFTTLSGSEQEASVDAPRVEFKDSITLDAVSYTYPGAVGPAIADITLTIRRGESIGIVGQTGAGKSTLVDVILALLPPTTGRIAVDGTTLSPTSIPWRRRVGYVPQVTYLTDDTLRRNIAFGMGDTEIDDARIRSVLAATQLNRFVGQLPHGIETRVGERGVRLSGGERQRIAIARALYHDPDVLIFDEATSSLDVETEAEITKTIMALHGIKTVVVIAHRLTSVKPCDRIVWLANGRIVDTGTFDQLQQRSAEFRALKELAAV